MTPASPTPNIPGPGRTALLAALLALAVGVVVYVSLLAPQDFGRAAPIWPANALTVACVLRAAPGRWRIWAAAGFVGNFAADLAIGNTVLTSAVLAGANLVEVLVCGLGLRRVIPGGFDPGRMRHLAVGLVFAVAGAFASAVLASAWLGLLEGAGAAARLTIWTVADTLGLIIPTPCLLILAEWRRRWSADAARPRSLVILAAALAVVTAVFAQDRYPLLFLAPLATVVVATNMGMVGAAVIVLATAGLAVGFTFAGHGPIAIVTAGWTERLILLQGFVAVCGGLTLQVAALQEERRLASLRLAAALAEAEQAARVKAEFLANMSHEIRTPLTSIIGFASLLGDRNLEAEARRYADRVLSASRNLLALVNDVLDFSKLEAGRLEIKRGPGSAAQCGRDVVDLFAPQASHKGLALSFEAVDLPDCVTADFDRVRQVLINLVGNAVKFTEAGEVRVRASFDARAGWLAFRVEDTGPGVPPEGQARLFQRFSQVDASLARAHEGSGLGLAISKGLVEVMGGRIHFESRPGEGSVFAFEVPAPLAEPAPAGQEAGPDLAALAGMRVLLADDSQANRELVRAVLAPLGVDLRLADGGAAAVRLTEAEDFELILMDLRMPGVDGWTAAEAIRRTDNRNRATPMLAFSADITADDETASPVFDGIVRKPIELAGLLGAVLAWAERDPSAARPSGS